MIKIIMFLCVTVIGLSAVDDNLAVPSGIEPTIGTAIPYVGNRSSPGIEVGVTDYDWMINGSTGRYVWATNLGGYNFYWTYRYGGLDVNRRASYNYYFPPDYWLGAITIDTRQSRMGALDQLSTGQAVASAHANNASNNTVPVCYVDAAEGAGTFTIYDVPVANPTLAPIWPKICVDDSDYIYLSGSQNPGPCGFWTKSTDLGVTWLPWDSIMGGVLLDANTFDYGGRETWAQYGEKIALVNTDGLTYRATYYWESTDHGASWTFDTVYAFGPADSVHGFYWNGAVYDNSGFLHVVLTAIDVSAGGGGTNYSGWRSQIWHWNQQNDQISLVDNGSGWVNSNPGPGTWHPTNSEPEIAINRVTGTLYCTWCHADPADVAQNGLVNMDIWGSYSTDNGATWQGHRNITNSPTPGAAPGNCDNDHVNTIAEQTLGDTLVMFYLNDKDAGNAAYPPDPGAVLTDSPMLFYLYYWPVGIQENKIKNPGRLSMNTTPNPVSRVAKLSYTLVESGDVSLKLYNVAGRLIETVCTGTRAAGTYTEYVDASQFANGTYFVVLETANEKITSSLIVVQ